MKAMTLWQPHASLIAEGVKNIETRPNRSPWSSAIGETIAIHAAVRKPSMFNSMPVNCCGDMEFCPVEGASCDGWRSQPTGNGGEWELRTPRRVMVRPLPLGAVVATCTLRDVVPMVEAGSEGDLPVLVVEEPELTVVYWGGDGVESPATIDTDVSDQRPFGDFAPGRFALILDDVVKMEHPIPVQGHQGLWRLDFCPYGDLTCPCQDGDTCHYVDDPATGTKALPIGATR